MIPLLPQTLPVLRLRKRVVSVPLIHLSGEEPNPPWVAEGRLLQLMCVSH